MDKEKLIHQSYNSEADQYESEIPKVSMMSQQPRHMRKSTDVSLQHHPIPEQEVHKRNLTVIGQMRRMSQNQIFHHI